MIPNSKKGTIIKWLFAAYSVLMIVLLFGRERSGVVENYWEQVGQNINYIPFRTIWGYLYIVINRTNPYLISHALVNLLGNIFAFIPMGFFLPFFSKKLKKFGFFLIAVILIILCVEIIQLFTLRGSFDVDDLILNTLGSIIGLIIFKCILKTESGKRNTK